MAATEAATDASGPRFAPDDPTLPEPWKGLIDGNTGMLYYWNQETNVTQYERPGETSAANTIPASVPQQSNASTPAPQQQMLYQNQYPSTVQQQAGQPAKQEQEMYMHQQVPPQQTVYPGSMPYQQGGPYMQGQPMQRPWAPQQQQHPYPYGQQPHQPQMSWGPPQNVPHQQISQQPGFSKPDEGAAYDNSQQMGYGAPQMNGSLIGGPRPLTQPNQPPLGGPIGDDHMRRIGGNDYHPQNMYPQSQPKLAPIPQSRPGENVPAPFMTFESTGFPPEILNEIRMAGFNTPTPIQAQTWPVALQNRDIVAIAKTGSGKTLGYLMPAFMHLKRSRSNPVMGPTVLVLAPTRELATQIQEEAVKFGRSSRISCTCLYGGAPKGPQLKELDRGADIVVATPGRLNDIIEMGRIKLRQVTFLVLDEADRMLDMGFEPQIRRVVNDLPPRRQTLMYTATWPKDVRKIAADLLRNPVQVNIGNVDELVANKSITQYVEVVGQMEKQRRLEQILRAQERGSKVIIFCATKKLCDQLARGLSRSFGAVAIHGDKSQAERDHVLQQFREGRSPILVATDVAARGLDIKDIRIVINYDFPTGIEDYVHRIGRTGRAGATGIAYTFFSDQDWNRGRDRSYSPSPSPSRGRSGGYGRDRSRSRSRSRSWSRSRSRSRSYSRSRSRSRSRSPSRSPRYSQPRRSRVSGFDIAPPAGVAPAALPAQVSAAADGTITGHIINGNPSIDTAALNSLQQPPNV
ncbi:DEAD-box ATP-dependent RNA helicase 46 isoform X2 [Carex littledalei]|uniref:RNA helicase n=1 Tax=Carex littledalei TaxID=544730 RepID=A0A833VEA9_9POAL|nr:DEAD-box ATP-dependent RNA helicase 46 isoform X2 [Carex littledalei]